MAKTRDERAKGVSIAEQFVPRFWDSVDGRTGIAKEIRRRFEELKTDTGADTAQKEMLCQRAIFIGIQLETMEIEAAQEGKLDAGVYTQMSNALLGLLKALGLERKQAKALDLRSYVKERNA